MTDPRHDRRRASVAFTASLAVTAVALLTPEVPGPGVLGVPGEDKLVHAALFAVLALTAGWRFGVRPTLLVVLAAYAGATEVAQELWIASRGGDVLDLVADLVGVVLGRTAARAWQPWPMGSVATTSRPD